VQAFPSPRSNSRPSEAQLTTSASSQQSPIATGAWSRRCRPTQRHNWLGFTFEHATTALKFITTGTLDKFPRLEIVLPHGGGAFPFIFARIEHGFYHMGSVQYSFVEQLKLPAGDLDRILRGNAKRLLHL
jgi:predicted TIM-barrel fold metal-dependent hydrolase